MDNSTFRKKLNDLGNGAREKLEKFFGGRIQSAKDFKDKFSEISEKSRARIVKSVGAGVLSLAILCGFTGCAEPGKNENETKQVTLVSDSEISTVKPNYTTHETAEDVTPGETTVAVTPNVGETSNTPVDGSSSKPSDSTEVVPQDSTTGEVSTNKPSDDTTIKPVDSTVTTPSTEISVPVTDTTTQKTPDTTEPTTEEDLPADEDGYVYPEFFKKKLYEWVVLDHVLKSETSYYDQMCEVEPEILFVDREKHTSEEPRPIVIYAKYTLNESGTNVQYVRFVASIKDKDYVSLGKPSRYSSYAEYVGAIQSAMETKCEFVDAQISNINSYNLIDLNNSIGAGFAKFVGDEFVDAEINFSRRVYGNVLLGTYTYEEYFGFVYDKEGKSYSFSVQIDAPTGYYESDIQMIKDIEAGIVKKEECVRVDTVTKRIDSVFTKESQAVNE